MTSSYLLVELEAAAQLPSAPILRQRRSPEQPAGTVTHTGENQKGLKTIRTSQHGQATAVQLSERQQGRHSL